MFAHRFYSSLPVLTAALLLCACTVLEPERIDYKSAAKAPTLEIPPDLTALSRDSRYVVVGGVVSASSLNANPAQAGASVATNAISDARIERSGNKRWLVVARPADQLWNVVRDFWQENGFLLTEDRQDLGIMETDWAENRAKIPQDVIRSTLGKVFDSLYDTGERDRFRTRLERSGNNTEIYITHRGMVEKVLGGSNASTMVGTVWEPRASDTELETEMLRRLMIRLGASQEYAKAQVATSRANANPPAVAQQSTAPAPRSTNASTPPAAAPAPTAQEAAKAQAANRPSVASPATTPSTATVPAATPAPAAAAPQPSAAPATRSASTSAAPSTEAQEAAKAQDESRTGDKPKVRVTRVNGAPAVQIDDDFDRTWRRVGLSLDRTGFSVDDKDRAKGLYFVRYTHPAVEQGVMAKLFGQPRQDAQEQKYQIALTTQGEMTTLSILNDSGKPENSANGQRLARLIANDLR